MAGVAAIRILGRNRVVAGGTIDAVPFVERAVGGARVVSSQDLAHENEELADQAIGQGRRDRLLTVAFTKGLATDMWVWMSRGTLIRVDSRYGVGRTLRQAVEFELDLKRAQVEVFENDSLGRDRESALTKIDPDILELSLQDGDLGVEL